MGSALASIQMAHWASALSEYDESAADCGAFYKHGTWVIYISRENDTFNSIATAVNDREGAGVVDGTSLYQKWSEETGARSSMASRAKLRAGEVVRICEPSVVLGNLGVDHVTTSEAAQGSQEPSDVAPEPIEPRTEPIEPRTEPTQARTEPTQPKRRRSESAALQFSSPGSEWGSPLPRPRRPYRT